ncbi:hypothetical protein HFO56_02710 [Rhizobium laguerreae]|uniref:PcfJ domain-containing protein n=1 Tax=Rhizobium laguerreae TaxID=1076926 RepID=UPI001C910686|nr:PcfJ domain-containing protein [Rhizobium laguerreae]MBY3151297.1 hypothetical protein [Rhizobium laguerreae]
MAVEQDSEIVDFLSTFTEDAEVVRLLYHCVGRILLKIKNSKRNWREAGLAVDLKDAADWLEVALLHKEDWLFKVDEHGRPKKLLKFADLDGILKEANKAMIKRAVQTPVIRIDEGEEVLEQVLGSGWYMVRLLTPRALDNESFEMQHCVGHGTYDTRVANGQVVILSLRDPHNKPHVTIEVDTRTNSVVQIRGKQNARPKAEYARRVRQFIRDRDYDSIYRPIEIGLVVDEMGKAHSIDNLPEGLAIKGNLDLSEYALTALPAFLEVRGDLKIAGSAIRDLPRGLRVTGSLLATKSRLERLPVDHGIARSIDVSSTMITELPDGLEVDGDLDISDTMMRRLPEDLVVTGHLKMESTDIPVFPASAVIGLNLFLSGSGIRRFEGNSLYVGGCLMMNNCGRVHFPERVTVERAMFMEKTEIASGAKVFEVGGNFYCQNSNFTTQSRKFRARGRVIDRREARTTEFALAMPLAQFERQFGVRD